MHYCINMPSNRGVRQMSATGTLQTLRRENANVWNQPEAATKNVQRAPIALRHIFQ